MTYGFLARLIWMSLYVMYGIQDQRCALYVLSPDTHVEPVPTEPAP